MKKKLLSSFAFLLISASHLLYAQGGGNGNGNNGNGNGNGGPTSACAVTNVTTQNSRIITSTATSCTGELDVSFTININNGNKFIFIQSYLLTPPGTPNAYPNYFNCTNGNTTVNKAPERDDIGNPLLLIGINTDRQTPTLLNEYTPDTRVPIMGVTANTTISSEIVAGGATRFTIRNIRLNLPVACNSSYTVVTDVWSSQAANAKVVNCANCNLVIPSPTGLAITGQSNCVTGNFAVRIGNQGTTAINGNVRIFADTDGNNQLNSADVQVLGSTPLNIGANGNRELTGTLPAGTAGFDLLVVVTPDDGTASTTVLPTTSCAALPVSFKMFNATRRTAQNVQLDWQTASEQNNKGFYVERLLAGKGWQTLAFVNSKAVNGNSSADLNYSFTDINNVKGISQYRLRQVDIDGRFKYSNTRAVHGDQQGSRTLIFPNPASSGAFTILFEDVNTLRNVIVSDVSGRIVQQWRNIAGNSLRVENLVPGMYTISIANLQNSTQTVEKVVVANQ